MIILLHFIYVYSEYLLSRIKNRNRESEITTAVTDTEDENDESVVSNRFTFDKSADTFDNAVYDCETNKIRFFPPVYVQRYITVIDILKDEKWKTDIKKVVDFGCSELGFFKHLKDLDDIEKIVEIDIDKDVLQQFSYRVQPWVSDYLKDRNKPLEVTILCGNACRPDRHLEDADAVVAIELIEHLYPPDLEELPFNIFGVVKPRIAIFTTPNEEFNVLFEDFSGFRHDDHKFEWRRNEFENWARNICCRFPNYEVNFFGVGPGPVGQESVGSCSQGAVFMKKKLVPEDNYFPEAYPLSSFDEYEVIEHVNYPYRQDTRSESNIILDDVKNFVNVAIALGSYENNNRLEIPLASIFMRVNRKCNSLERLKNALEEDSKYNIEKDKNGDYIVVIQEPDFHSEGGSDVSSDPETHIAQYTEHVSEDALTCEDWDKVEQPGTPWDTCYEFPPSQQMNDSEEDYMTSTSSKLVEGKSHSDTDRTNESFGIDLVNEFSFIKDTSTDISCIEAQESLSLNCDYYDSDEISFDRTAKYSSVNNLSDANTDGSHSEEVDFESIDQPIKKYSKKFLHYSETFDKIVSNLPDFAESSDSSHISGICVDLLSSKMSDDNSSKIDNDLNSITEYNLLQRESKMKSDFDYILSSKSISPLEHHERFRSEYISQNAVQNLETNVVQPTLTEIQSKETFSECSNLAEANLEVPGRSDINVANSGDLCKRTTLEIDKCIESVEENIKILSFDLLKRSSIAKDKSFVVLKSSSIVNSVGSRSKDELLVNSNISLKDSHLNNNQSHDSIVAAETNIFESKSQLDLSTPESDINHDSQHSEIDSDNRSHCIINSSNDDESVASCTHPQPTLTDSKKSKGVYSRSSLASSSIDNIQLYEEMITANLKVDKKPNATDSHSNDSVLSVKLPCFQDEKVISSFQFGNEKTSFEKVEFVSDNSLCKLAKDNYDDQGTSQIVKRNSTSNDKIARSFSLECLNKYSQLDDKMCSSDINPSNILQEFKHNTLLQNCFERNSISKNINDDECNYDEDDSFRDFSVAGIERQDSYSPDKAVDSGYPNSNSGRDMEMDLTPEQVKEILTEGESSFENTPLDSPVDEEGPIEVPIIPHPPIVHLGDNVENGDVANNNRDGEGNNMIGQAEMIGEALEFHAVIAQEHEMPLMDAAIIGDEFANQIDDECNRIDGGKQKKENKACEFESNAKSCNSVAIFKKEENLKGPEFVSLLLNSEDSNHSLKINRTVLDEASECRLFDLRRQSNIVEVCSSSYIDPSLKFTDTDINTSESTSFSSIGSQSFTNIVNWDGYKMVSSYDIKELTQYPAWLARNCSVRSISRNDLSSLNATESSGLSISNSLPSGSNSDGPLDLCVLSPSGLSQLSDNLAPDTSNFVISPDLSSVPMRLFNEALTEFLSHNFRQDLISHNIEPFADWLLQIELVTAEDSDPELIQNVNNEGGLIIEEQNFDLVRSESILNFTVLPDVKGGGDSSQ